MTRAAWTVVLCLAAAAGEVGLLAATITDWDAFFPVGVAFLGFLVGPLVFLAVVAWRRRTHVDRTRWLLRLAAVVAAAGLAGFTIHLVADAELRKNPLLNPAVVPLGQWVLVLFAWLRITAAERIEKRRAARSEKTGRTI